jgi:2-polyprenyl-3-methyl-5-hydroxy-6-metoxy-1,4-benzoquinol methylase
VDFGCGSGVMSHLLAQMGHEVIAVDLDFAPLERVRRHVDFPPSITFHNKDLAELQLPAESVDAIVALDVLEHIHDFESYLALFLRILKPGGRIIVSGPTENWLYKLGRKLAGKQFSGDYHETNIAAIRAAFARQLNVKMHARLIWPFTLFEIFSVQKPN